jgi:hypothetical protein
LVRTKIFAGKICTTKISSARIHTHTIPVRLSQSVALPQLHIQMCKTKVFVRFLPK